MRLTSVSAAHWLYVDDEAAHRMSEQSIAKAGMAENSTKTAIKKDAINGPNWRFQRLISLFGQMLGRLSFGAIIGLRSNLRPGKADPPG
jgi:hypothetical protein